jgi:hypothetical protein
MTIADFKKRTYLGVGIYSAVALSICVAALVVRDALPAAFALALVFGILVTMVYLVVAIVMNERFLNKRSGSDALQLTLPVRSCPDYWTLRPDGTCANEYVVRRAPGDNPTLPASTTYTWMGAAPPLGGARAPVAAPATATPASLDGRTIKQVCTSARDLEGKAPWTDVTSVCDGFKLP